MKITGLAIDKGIHITYGPKKNGVIEMSSLQFEKRANRWSFLFRGSDYLYAMEMPGKRYDIGELESYRKVEEEYKGIQK